jgi:hypothetical protein
MFGGLALLLVFLAAACDREPQAPPLDPEILAASRAVEEKAGPFLDYYVTVLELAQRLSTNPDSFEVELDRLPGSHLTEEEWTAWVAPHAADPDPLADRLEELLSELASRR